MVKRFEWHVETGMLDPLFNPVDFFHEEINLFEAAEEVEPGELALTVSSCAGEGVPGWSGGSA